MTERSDRPEGGAAGRVRDGGAEASSRVPERAQVVIVGGGVIGCSVAYHLAHLG